MLLRIGSPGLAVALVGCEDLLADVGRAFVGWPLTRVAGDAPPPVLALARAGNRYELRSPLWPAAAQAYRDPVDALCALIAEFVAAYLRQAPRMLCLHGAAAVLAGRLVVFPSQYGAGKSVLAACLAARGIRLFGDDVLLVEGTSGRALAAGFLPRLRLPLPDDLSDDMRAFVRARTALAGNRYAYLDLPEAALARHGERARIGAFVLLDRRPGTSARLTRLSRSEALRRVARQNFARGMAASTILTRLHDLVAGTRCHVLRYGHAEEAAELLEAAFAHWREAQPPRGAVPRRQAPARPPATGATGAAGPLYVHARGVVARGVGGKAFLASDSGAGIYHLNRIGAAIWDLLQQPTGASEIVGLLADAFPETDREQLQEDVERLLARLVQTGFVRRG